MAIHKEAWFVRVADERELAKLRLDALRGDQHALNRYWNLMGRMGFPESGVDAEILKVTPMSMWGQIPLILIAKHREQMGPHMGKWGWVASRSFEEIVALPSQLQPQIRTLAFWADPEGQTGSLDDVTAVNYALPIENPLEGGEVVPYASENIIENHDDWRPHQILEDHGKLSPYEEVAQKVRWALGPGEFKVSHNYSSRDIVQLFTTGGYEEWLYYWYFVEIPWFMWDVMSGNDS